MQYSNDMDSTFTSPSGRVSISDAKQEAVCRANIFSAPDSSYGSQYKDHFFAQYKLYVDSVNYTSELKLKINSYFLTINTALITAVGLINAKQSLNPFVWHFLIPLAGVLISCIWWGIIYSYKQRVIVKLRIIHCLEEILPLALFKTEWDLMNLDHNTPLKKFFFQIDVFIPFIFIVSYLFFVLIV